MILCCIFHKHLLFEYLHWDLLQALTPFASGPVFGMLYGRTVDYFPQAIIYLMVSIKAVMFLDLMAIYFTMKADDKTRENIDKLKNSNILQELS